ncbi:hypothetical protein [Caballeronia sp. LZ001]|uniref:hypothetical protein n=1 Tax=Caballeronia sp. LZ001 TaxID=3038553 RepID=UPI00285829AF|nr:hypothetical protein [Caballeronia sp. LZ001]MDR5802747.1 hypothetical protein [Caballeronia sp. LZ001]
MSSNLTASASAISKSPVISELRGFLFFGAQLIHQQARTARFSFDHDELVAPTLGNQEIRASRTAYSRHALACYRSWFMEKRAFDRAA